MAATPSLFIILIINAVTLCDSISIDCVKQNQFFLGTVFIAFDPSFDNGIRSICDDFSNSTELVLGIQGDVTHVKYDPMYELVYWADTGNSTINRGHVDTDSNYTNANPCFTEVVMSNVTNALVEIDPVNRKLYWGSSFDSLIGVAEMDGSNSVELYNKTTAAENVIDIRVDAEEGLIFWGSTTSNGRIAKGSVSGGNHTVIYSDVEVRCIEINAAAGVVYWITFLSRGSSPATMQSANYKDEGDSLDTNFLTIDVNTDVVDMILYDGYFYLTTFNFGMDFEVKVYRVLEEKGAVAMPLEYSAPLDYLFAEPGIISSLDTVISLAKLDYNGAEGAVVAIQVHRTGNLFRCSSVTLETSSGSATPEEDYVHMTTVVQFPALSTVQTVEIKLLPDEELETDETFMVALSSASKAILGENVKAIMTIQGSPNLAEPYQTGEIVGIAIGAIAGFLIVVLIIVAIAIYASRKQKSGEAKKTDPEEMKDLNKTSGSD